MEESTPTVCKLCLIEASRYTCPRCNIVYCSSACYKSEAHLQCSEQFYKESCLDAMKDTDASPEDREKVLEMLARLEDTHPCRDSDDESDDSNLSDDSALDLEERMAGLDLDRDTDAIWEKLTVKEKQQFETMLADGRLGNLIESWQPWWTTMDSGLVEELGSTSVGTVPKLLKKFTPIDTLLKSAPSPLLPFTVVNIIYGYVYITKVHNGDHFNSIHTVTKELCSVCQGLTGKNFTDACEAVHHCMQIIEKQESLHISREFSAGVIKDVIDILMGIPPKQPNRYTLAALSDLHRLYTQCKQECKKDIAVIDSTHKSFNAINDSKQQCFNVCKKLEFLIAWTHKYGALLGDVIPLLEMEYCAITTDLAKHAATTSHIEKKWGGIMPPPKKSAPLIAEIPDE